MSGADLRIRRWMIERAGLAGSRLLVAAAVLGACDEHGGRAAMSTADLIDATGLSRSTVRQAVGELVDDGFIRRLEDPDPSSGSPAEWAPGAKTIAMRSHERR